MGRWRRPRWTPFFLAAIASFIASAAFLGLVLESAARERLLAPKPVSASSAESRIGQPAVGPSVRAVSHPGAADDKPAPLAGASTTTAEVVPPRGSEGLRAAIAGVLGAREGISVVVHRFSDGLSVALNPDREHYAASLFKLAVLYGVESKITAGELSLDGAVGISAADASEDLGTFSRLGIAPGESITIRDALDAMITVSDNSSAVALMHLVGASQIDSTLRALGLRHTSVNTFDLPTTAGEMARLMEAIVRGEGLAPGAAARMMDMLLRQETRSGIPAGVPRSVAVGNKTGTWAGATHDVAYVDAPGGSYVIAVLSDGDWAWPVISAVSAAVYRVMSTTPSR